MIKIIRHCSKWTWHMNNYPYYCVMKTRNPNIYPSRHQIVTIGSRTWFPSRSYDRMEAWVAMYTSLLKGAFVCVQFCFGFIVT